MKLYALVLEDVPQSLSQVRSLLRQNQFEVLEAATPEEAERLLVSHCPHLIFVDLDAANRNLAWVESVKKGPFARVPLAVSSSSTRVGTLQRCIQVRVTDYILKPFHPSVLGKKLQLLCSRIALQSPYEVRPTPHRPLGAEMTTECVITAISETGIQVGGALMTVGPVERLSFVTPLFDAIGVRKPMLKLTNTGKREASGGGGETEFVNFVQVQGWGEDDRKLLRHWIRNRKLEVLG